MSSLVNALHVSRHQPCKLPIEEVLQTVKIKVPRIFRLSQSLGKRRGA